MKIYLGGRGTGKTQRMIDEASKHPNSVIVVATFGQKISLEARLQHEGKNYIKVVTINEIASDWIKTVRMHDYKFFFDDVQNCLCTLMNNSGVIGGMSINVEPVIDEVRSDVIAVSSYHNDYMDCLRYCINRFETKEEKKMPPKNGNTGTFYFDEFFGLDRGHGFQRVPHIEHVIFNGPATIVFWKDGTKTVVKLDERYVNDRRKAILYAFIRKIYGEGRPYHDILNEIEWALEEGTNG